MNNPSNPDLGTSIQLWSANPGNAQTAYTVVNPTSTQYVLTVGTFGVEIYFDATQS